MLSILIIFANICLDRHYLNWLINPGAYGNRFIGIFLLFLVFSVFYYYLNLMLGNIIMFGSAESFFRNWMGRPIGQFLSIVTYGIIPYFLVKAYAKDDIKRSYIEKIIVFSTLFLVFYGYFQQISYYFGLPVTGRLIYEGSGVAQRIPAFSVFNIRILRFYSLGGEPRDFGAFIIGAIFFYLYFIYGREKKYSKTYIILMIIAYLLTASTSAFLIIPLSFGIILIDLMHNKSLDIRKIKYICSFLAAIIIVIYLAGPIIGARTKQYYELFSKSFGEKQGYVSAELTSQSVDLSIVNYLMDSYSKGFSNILIGSGLGNFSTAIAPVLKDYYNFDISTDPNLANSRSFFIYFLIECGVVGLFIYSLIFLNTLRMNKIMINYYKPIDKTQYNKTLLLRYAFIVFFVSNLIHYSSYYFIIMGLIAGKINSIPDLKKKKAALQSF